LGGTFALLAHGYGLISLILFGFALAALAWLVSIFFVRRCIPNLRLKFSRVRWSAIREDAHFSAVVLLGTLSWKILFEAARVVIGIFRPLASVAIYEVSLSICLYSRSVFYVTSVLTSSSAHLNTTGNIAGIQSIYLIGTKYLFATYSAVAVALMIFGKEFIALWMGPGFVESSGPMNVLLAGSLFQSQNVVAIYVLMGMNRLDSLKKALTAHIFISCILFVVLVPRWGLMGAAVATTISIVFVESWFLHAIAQTLELTLRSVLRRCHTPAVAPTICGVISIFVVKQVINLDSWGSLISSVIFFLAVWCGVFFATGTTSDERAEIKGMVARQVALLRRTSSLS
jgi:O-antigen/teichoic acid export membrane protein